MTLQNYIKIFNNILADEENNALDKIVKNLKYETAATIGGVNTNVRNTQIYGLNELDKSLTMIHWLNFMNYMFQQFSEMYKKITSASHLHFRPHARFELQILKYESGGFYDVHTDHAEEVPRTLSFVYFINDDYEGGNLHFILEKNNVVTVEKKRNSLVIFPSNFLYPHTVEPVTKGTRYTVVGWIL